MGRRRVATIGRKGGGPTRQRQELGIEPEGGERSELVRSKPKLVQGHPELD